MRADDRLFVIARLDVPLDCSDRAAVAAAWPPDTLGFGNQDPIEQQEQLDLLPHQQSTQLASHGVQQLSSRGHSSLQAQQAGPAAASQGRRPTAAAAGQAGAGAVLQEILSSSHTTSQAGNPRSQSVGSMVLKMPGVQGALMHRKPPDYSS
jgi:hypothetical protein